MKWWIFFYESMCWNLEVLSLQGRQLFSLNFFCQFGRDNFFFLCTLKKLMWIIENCFNFKVFIINHVFELFCRLSIRQLRKNHNRKPLVTCQFSGTCLQSQNFGGTSNLLWLLKGQLWSQISRVLLVICSAYIYSLERFFGQLFIDAFENFANFKFFWL
jgi:hypothetical protein